MKTGSRPRLRERAGGHGEAMAVPGTDYTRDHRFTEPEIPPADDGGEEESWNSEQGSSHLQRQRTSPKAASKARSKGINSL